MRPGAATSAGLLASTFLVLAGCAQAPKGKSIAPATLAVDHTHEAPVEVHVRGGGDGYRLSNEALHEAIVLAIERSQVFGKVLDDGAPYRLDVVIGGVHQPPIGWNFTVEVKTVWNLSTADTNETIWQETITGTDQATPGDAVVAVNRLRIATERAARACVEEGIRRLSALDLQ